MATLLPPPRRQKQAHHISQHEETKKTAPVPTVVVQFLSDDGSNPIAPPVALPADVPRAQLEALVNQLSNSGDDPTPFDLHVSLPEGKAGAPTRVTLSTSILVDVLSLPGAPLTSEDVIKVRCSPQSIFRVRPATRCSSTLSGHKAPILCAAFSPTGDILATGSGDNTARLWDLMTETPSHTLEGHRGWVLCVEWEARQRIVATGGHDNAVRLWEPKTGKPIGGPLTGHTKWVTSLAWEPIHINPTNPRLASSSKDGTVRVWSSHLRRVEYILGGHTASVNVVRWGGTGKGRLYTASSDRSVRIWDAERGQCIWTLSDHAHWVTTLTLNTDFVLRTGPFDHTNQMPKSDAEARESALKRYEAVTARNSEMLITGSDDHTLFLYSLPSSLDVPGDAGSEKRPKPIARLTGHQRQVSHVAFSPDGRWAASAGWDGAVKVWDGKTGKFVATFRGHVAPVYRLSWSADSRLLITASKDSTLKIWSLKTLKLHTDLPGHNDEVYCVDFVGDKIVSGGKDGLVKIWKN
ncbi:WD-repeat protein [Calocera viscosa TUFC12733]|uniref:WD-repeat protein n=1 Tax=Calocera viscosa (strain TUFC12733) TaxID=1330018 RepID=A0A167KTQ2_CALVF|nr:WD-repeat protein [Calocera viscosa TUFC12733]